MDKRNCYNYCWDIICVLSHRSIVNLILNYKDKNDKYLTSYYTDRMTQGIYLYEHGTVDCMNIDLSINNPHFLPLRVLYLNELANLSIIPEVQMIDERIYGEDRYRCKRSIIKYKGSESEEEVSVLEYNYYKNSFQCLNTIKIDRNNCLKARFDIYDVKELLYLLGKSLYELTLERRVNNFTRCHDIYLTYEDILFLAEKKLMNFNIVNKNEEVIEVSFVDIENNEYNILLFIETMKLGY